MRWSAILVLLWCGLAAAAPAKVAPPAGWIENPQSAEGPVAKIRSTRGVINAILRQWDAPDGGSVLQTVEMEIRRDGRKTRPLIEEMETVAKVGMGKAGREVSLTRREQANQIIVDHVIATEQSRMLVRRYYAADAHDSIHYLMATCMGPADAPLACEPTLAALSLDVDAVPLDEVNWKARIERVAFYVGLLTSCVGMVGLLVHLIRKKRRATRAAR